MILKLKNITFTTIKVLFFLEDVDVEKVLVSKKISFDEKIYNYFPDLLYNDYKIKPLHIILPKTTAYLKL